MLFIHPVQCRVGGRGRSACSTTSRSAAVRHSPRALVYDKMRKSRSESSQPSAPRGTNQEPKQTVSAPIPIRGTGVPHEASGQNLPTFRQPVFICVAGRSFTRVDRFRPDHAVCSVGSPVCARAEPSARSADALWHAVPTMVDTRRSGADDVQTVRRNSCLQQASRHIRQCRFLAVVIAPTCSSAVVTTAMWLRSGVAGLLRSQATAQAETAGDRGHEREHQVLISWTAMPRPAATRVP